MTDRPDLGLFLRGIREQRGLSLREAADALDITKSYLGRLERTYAGVGVPSDELIHRMARFYDVPVDALFGLSGKVPDDLRAQFAHDPMFIDLVRMALRYYQSGPNWDDPLKVFRQP